MLQGPAKHLREQGPLADSGIFAPGQRGLTIGLVLVLVVVAFEGLAVTTIMPVTVKALHGLPLYAWSFSGFMLGSLVGTVVAGDYAAERGAAFSFTGALAILAAGLIICGVANNMLLFIAGRVIEGLGTGAVRSLTWFAINRAYSASDHVRMGAALSSAYIVPTLIGPTAAGVMAEVWGWRVVFFALLPLVPVVLWLIVRALNRFARTQAASAPTARKAVTAGVIAAGLAFALAGLQLSSIPLVGSGAVRRRNRLHRRPPCAARLDADFRPGPPRDSRDAWNPDLWVFRSSGFLPDGAGTRAQTKSDAGRCWSIGRFHRMDFRFVGCGCTRSPFRHHGAPAGRSRRSDADGAGHGRHHRNISPRLPRRNRNRVLGTRRTGHGNGLQHEFSACYPGRGRTQRRDGQFVHAVD